jgi:crotonobetainyl-CoA:carnitine CoA-transferase CaiB-like acyl-CoA transferase
MQDPHVEAIGLLRPINYPGMDKPVPIIDTAVRLSRQNRDLNRAPLTGEHTDAVLAEVGYSAADIAKLRADKVI